MNTLFRGWARAVLSSWPLIDEDLSIDGLLNTIALDRVEIGRIFYLGEGESVRFLPSLALGPGFPAGTQRPGTATNNPAARDGNKKHISPNRKIRPGCEVISVFGAVDTIRFLSQFRAGTGNYTEEREQLFTGMSTKDIIADIKSRRRSA